MEIFSVLIGLFGSLISEFFKLRRSKDEFNLRKLELDYELKRMQHELTLFNAQASSALEVTSLNREADILQSSYDHDANIGASYKWVNALRSLIRPVITLLLILGIFILPQDRIIALSLHTLLFVVIGWWFGDRTLNAVKRFP